MSVALAIFVSFLMAGSISKATSCSTFINKNLSKPLLSTYCIEDTVLRALESRDMYYYEILLFMYYLDIIMLLILYTRRLGHRGCKPSEVIQLVGG